MQLVLNKEKPFLELLRASRFMSLGGGEQWVLLSLAG